MGSARWGWLCSSWPFWPRNPARISRSVTEITQLQLSYNTISHLPCSNLMNTMYVSEYVLDFYLYDHLTKNPEWTVQISRKNNMEENIQQWAPPVGYGLRGSPCCQVSGAETECVEEIRWAYFMSSSLFTGRLLARKILCIFCLAWNSATDCNDKGRVVKRKLLPTTELELWKKRYANCDTYSGFHV